MFIKAVIVLCNEIDKCVQGTAVQVLNLDFKYSPKSAIIYFNQKGYLCQKSDVLKKEK
jgi:hypothetical protein